MSNLRGRQAVVVATIFATVIALSGCTSGDTPDLSPPSSGTESPVLETGCPAALLDEISEFLGTEQGDGGTQTSASATEVEAATYIAPDSLAAALANGCVFLLQRNYSDRNEVQVIGVVSGHSLSDLEEIFANAGWGVVTSSEAMLEAENQSEGRSATIRSLEAAGSPPLAFPGWLDYLSPSDLVIIENVGV